MEDRETINQRCQRIATLSPVAAHKLDTEQWRASFEDSEVDLEPIQQVLVTSLVADLTNIGVELVGSLEDVYASGYDLNLFLTACEWIFPNTLYPALRGDDVLQTIVRAIVVGDIDGKDHVKSLLLYIGGEEPEEGYKPDLFDACQFTMGLLRSSPEFTTYLKNLLDQAQEELSTDLPSLINDPKAYHDAITSCVVKLHTVQQDLMKDLTVEQKALFEKRIHFSCRMILNPEYLNTFGWLLTTDPKTLDDFAKAVYEKKKKIVLTGLKIAPEYYEPRGFTPNLIDRYGMTAYFMALDGLSKKDALEKVSTLYPE